MLTIVEGEIALERSCEGVAVRVEGRREKQGGMESVR